MSLVDLAQREIFEPLKLENTFFNPGAAARTGVAACETGNAYERGMCERDFTGRNYSGWRTERIWGQVHDGNAYFLGGAASRSLLKCRRNFASGKSVHWQSFKAAFCRHLQTIPPKHDCRLERSAIVCLATRRDQRFYGERELAARCIWPHGIHRHELLG